MEDYDDANITVFKVTCNNAHCEKVFETTRRTRKYCSDTCRYESLLKRQKDINRSIARVALKCKNPECSNIFYSTSSDTKKSKQKYCSTECRVRHKYSNRDTLCSSLEKELLPSPRLHKCPNCNKEFLISYKGQHQVKYCSLACKIDFTKNNQISVFAKPKPRMKDDFGADFNRKCHDCQKPTNDYRCADCQLQWKKKHGLSLF